MRPLAVLLLFIYGTVFSRNQSNTRGIGLMQLSFPFPMFANCFSKNKSWIKVIPENMSTLADYNTFVSKFAYFLGLTLFALESLHVHK